MKRARVTDQLETKVNQYEQPHPVFIWRHYNNPTLIKCFHPQLCHVCFFFVFAQHQSNKTCRACYCLVWNPQYVGLRFMCVSVILRMWLSCQHACVCADCHSCPYWKQMGFLSILLHNLPLIFQGGLITAHNKHLFSLAGRPRMWVFIVIGSVSLIRSQSGGTSQNEECELNFMFPIFDCSLNKWVKGRREETQGSQLVRLSLFVWLLHTCTPTETDRPLIQTTWRLSET